MEVTLFTPASGWNFFIYLNSRGYYILPLLVLSDQKKYTIQIAIKNFIGNTGVDWSSILAASVLSILPIVILFMILQKYIVGGVSAGGVKG